MSCHANVASRCCSCCTDISDAFKDSVYFPTCFLELQSSSGADSSPDISPPSSALSPSAPPPSITRAPWGRSPTRLSRERRFDGNANPRSMQPEMCRPRRARGASDGEHATITTTGSAEHLKMVQEHGLCTNLSSSVSFACFVFRKRMERRAPQLVLPPLTHLQAH